MMADIFAELDALDLPDHVKARLRDLKPAPVPHADTLVARLSLVRTFTQPVYEAAAQDLADAPAFLTFAATPDAEPVPGSPARYAITPSARAAHIPHWLDRPDERASLARRLADSIDPADPIGALDRLQLGFLGDQEPARAALRAVFEAADAVDDVSRCIALTQIVAPVIQQCGDDASAALLADLRARSYSRSLFFAELTQTRRYFRRSIEDDLRQFVNQPDDCWIFHVWAAGGMGKTTMLRRLIAHEWVRGATHAPCAWLDLDYLDVPTILQHPALLGLVMAAQWNEQLAQPVFGSFLDPTLIVPFGSLLFRSRSDGSGGDFSNPAVQQRARTQYNANVSNPMRIGMLAGAVAPRTLEERQRRMNDAGILLSYWTDKLPDALASMPTDRPVVLVLDTLEEASLHHGSQLLDMLKLVSRLRERARDLARTTGRPPVNLRLILSGRYELGREHVQAFATEFKGAYRTAELPGLDSTAAHAFLDELLAPEVPKTAGRDRAELEAAIVEKSLGIPFNLVLFAEWANDDPGLTPAMVRRSDDVNAVMLIERTVKRITCQPLRWIVRYGVVPRTLSLAFLRDVMREPLVEALSGLAATSGADVPVSTVEQDVWVKEDGFTFDAEVLWHDVLLPYASARSWVTPGERPDQVVFRSDIIQPMRRLLRVQRVFRQLHVLARDWFAEQSGDPGERRAAAIEYLFHCMQLRAIDGTTEDLLPRLRTLLSEPAVAADPGLRRWICAALQHEDFAELRPIERAFVGYTYAEATAAANSYSYRTTDAVNALKDAVELAGSEIDALPPFAGVWERATRSGATVSALVDALKTLPSDDRSRLALLLSEMSFADSGMSKEVLATAVSAAQKQPQPAVPVGVLAERLASMPWPDDPETAVRYLTIAADDYAARSDDRKASELSLRLAAVELQIGRPAQSRLRLDSHDARYGRTPASQRRRADVEIALGSPSAALALLESTGSDPDGVLARATALSQQMLLQEAQDARTKLGKSDVPLDVTTIGRISVDQARLYRGCLRVTLGHIPALVQSALLDAQTRTADLARTSVDGAEIEAWLIACGFATGEEWLRRARRDYALQSPLARIRLTWALSQIVTEIHPRRWRDLVDDATRLPSSMRMRALEPPVLWGTPPVLDPETTRAIAGVFQHEPKGDEEAAWYAVRRGDLLAWLGFEEEAIDMLARVPVLTSTNRGWRAATYRERRRIEQGMRDRVTDRSKARPRPEPDGADLWRRVWGHTPFRAAAATVENAQRAVDAGELDLARECLQFARPLLRTMPLETEFHLLANRVELATAKTAATSIQPPPVPSGVGQPAEVSKRMGGPAFHVVELSELHGRMFISSDREPLRRQVSAEDSETLQILLRSRGVARRLVKFPLDQIASDLAGPLREHSDLFLQSPRTAVKAPHVALSSAPWELAFQHLGYVGEWPFRLPSTWDEARVAEDTRIAEIELGLQRAASAAPVLLQPLSPQDRESPAARAYQQLRALLPRRMSEKHRIEGESWAVYVASSFVEVPGSEEATLAGLSWSASTLALTISSMAGPFRPLVVLDVPVPATATDLVHQLLLRNTFAQSLIDTGVAGAVLATGLRAQEDMSRLHRVIVGQLRPETSRLEFFDGVRRQSQDTAGFLFDAFFVASPYLPLAAGRPMYV